MNLTLSVKLISRFLMENLGFPKRVFPWEGIVYFILRGFMDHSIIRHLFLGKKGQKILI